MKTTDSKAPPYPVRRGGWPHPTFSRLSAHAFLERSRPNDEDAALLIGAYRPMPRRSFKPRDLATAFERVALAFRVIEDLWQTEARFRVGALRPAAQSLLTVMTFIVSEMRQPADDRMRVRHKLDRRDPRLSAAVNTVLAARQAGIPLPSASELAALAVLHDGEPAGQPPTRDAARRCAYWRTIRKRAARIAASVQPLVSDVHAQSLEAVKADAVRWMTHGDEWRTEIDALQQYSDAVKSDGAKGGSEEGTGRPRLDPRVRVPRRLS